MATTTITGLEGIQKTTKAISTTSNALTENTINLNNVEIKIGYLALGGTSNIRTINFDKPFANMCLGVVVGRVTKTNNETYAVGLIQGSITTTGFQAYTQNQTDRSLSYIAIGY